MKRIAPVVLLLAALMGACSEEVATTGPLEAPSARGSVSQGGSGGRAIGKEPGGALGSPIGGASASPTSGERPGSLPCDVQQAVLAKCGTCHTDPPLFGAPMPLTQGADFHAAGTSDKNKKVFELVKTRINTTNPSIRMPPTTSPALSPAELSALNAWLDQNAPAGACAEPAGATAVPVAARPDTTGLECHKLTAHAQGDKNAKFKVGVAQDAYYAFGFAAPWKTTVYGEVFIPIIDNPRAIHHWLLYEEPTTDGSQSMTIGQHGQGKLLAGWAPGGPPVDFRTYGDVGFELPATTYLLEVHYNSSDADAVDASGVELCVQAKKPQNVAGMSWLGYDQGAVLAATTGVCSPADKWTGECVPKAKEPIHILFVTPHLHQSGTHLKSVINGPRGSRVLIDQPFDFDYQITYPSREVLMPGETITTTCNYSKPQCFGQATTAEMCYLFTYSYPKGALADEADWGQLAHGEGTCLGQTTLDIF